MSKTGGKGNKSGKLFEVATAACLKECKISFTPQYSPGITGVMGENIKVDFWLPEIEIPEHDVGLYLECRWQASSGSTNKKTPCLCENIKTAYDLPTIVVIEGPKTGDCRRYLEQRVGGKLLPPLDFPGFILWCLENGDSTHPGCIIKKYNSQQLKLFST